MKNRKLLMLTVLVIGVWGLIGYRVFSYLGDEGTPQYATPRPREMDTTRAVTYVLALSYPDPFLKSLSLQPKPIVRSTRAVQTLRKTAPAPSPQVLVDWSKVKYLGVMSNTSRKIKTAAIRLDGRDYFVKEGEKLEQIAIVEARPDSLRVSMGTNSTWIKKVNN